MLPPRQSPPSPTLTPSKPLYLSSPFVEAALVKGNFKTIVMLPKYVDIMEWVAVNNYVMTWVQNLLEDDKTFPTKAGQDFPPNFPSTIKHVYRQLLRVFAHIYHAHYHQILHLRSEPHFNSLFAHFLAFGREYELLDMKDVKGQASAPVGIGNPYLPTRKESLGPSSEPPSPGGAKPLYLSSPFADAALVKGNFKTIVMLPKYVDIMEWVAVNMFDFYTNLNEFYGVLTECCTQHSCPTMSGGPTLNYNWTNQGGKQVSLSAPTYIDSVMSSIQNLLEDENAFPTKSNQAFHPSFPSTIKHVYRQLLRVFAHLYHAHFPQILHIRAEPHFNSLFAHFLAFGREYELLEVKDIKGDPNAPVGVGLLWERWKESGILA
ncbi:hypothetical protein H0H87_006823 [Tephrocybe sp. NHM501043]|nr:hypothetical protein H0H87_006823 [Tephrocybe sp. NHM501043]